MDKKVFDFFKRLADTPSPSGYEQPAQRVWREYVAPHADRVESDVMGNTWGVIEGTGGPRVMLSGHADEVGLMVRYIDDNGFFYFAAIGGIDPHLCRQARRRPRREGAGRRRHRPKAHPLLEDEERSKVSKLKELFIDLGAGRTARPRKARRRWATGHLRRRAGAPPGRPGDGPGA